MKSTFWPYSKDPYELFSLIIDNPRIPKLQMARIFHVNPLTLNRWWNAAIEKKIIIPPVFRRKSYSNFREYFYFLNVKDPHKLYELFQIKDLPLIYFSVHIGSWNFQIISREPLDFLENVLFSGPRSDYLVSIPPNRTFKDCNKKVNAILRNLDVLELRESPLTFHNEEYTPWDENDEAIYWNICNDLRKPFASVVKSSKTYNDKTWTWFKNRDKFGDTITMFFPEGETSYQVSLFCIDTEYDSLIIDIFSELPTSSVFYKICDQLMMCIYLPFFPSPDARALPFKALSILKKEELVVDYTNSIVQYGFRP